MLHQAAVFIGTKSNLGERQNWLLHRAEKAECECVGEGGRELGEHTHSPIWLAEHAAPSLPPTAQWSHIESAAGTAGRQSPKTFTLITQLYM